jgi:peptidyl-prolyl cis-trans isomerase B (cyclophilin B)
MVPGALLRTSQVSAIPGAACGCLDCRPVSKQSKRERQRLNREARRAYEESLAKRRRRLKTARNFAIFAVPVLVLGIVLSVSSSSSSSKAGGCTTVAKPPPRNEKLTAPALGIDRNAAYTAEITTNCGVIDVALDAKDFPVAVNNFVSLANQGFYDGLAVVRSAKGFVMQAGSPDQTAAGGPGYSVQAETPKTKPYYPVGTLAMAKTGSDPAGTAGSQFFIVTGAQAGNLTPDYAVVGKVTKGLAVAVKIASFAPSTGDGAPTKTIVMEKVRILTGTTPTTTGASSTSSSSTTPST